MNSWRVRAHGAFEATADEPPDSLRELLRACMPNPPRRINRYIRLALIGAHRCLGSLEDPLAPDTPVYMASEQGNAAEAISLLDEIVWHGRSPKPMSFINVSSNMVGYYLAASFGLHGRNINVARSHASFGAMLELASLEPYLQAPPQASILLGTVAECVWPLANHRRRCKLPADTPLVEASYWLLLGDKTEENAPRLAWASTMDEAQARAWLADGEYWAVDPHLADDRCRALASKLDEQRLWSARLYHRGHQDAVVHALFTALQTQPTPRLHVVAGDPSGGYQLMGIW